MVLCMRNIKLRLRKLKRLISQYGLTSLLLILFLYGCLSYRSAWEGDKNQLISKRLDPELILERGAYGAKHGSYFFNAFAERKFDRVKLEGRYTRYHITYGGPCKYSILLDENNVMLSWRYETKHRSRCTVH